MPSDSILAQAIAQIAIPLTSDSAYDALFERIGDARFVLLGEATHGTHEFYRIRAELTKRLIRDKGFTAIAAEADWPDAYRINRYLRGLDGDADANAALSDFQRFPQWMWRNTDVVDMVGWLRRHNDRTADRRAKVGFYGLDLYSLHASVGAVLRHLDEVDPDGAKRARERYACLDIGRGDPQRYGYAAALGLDENCEHQVLAQLVDMLKRRRASWEHAGLKGEDAEFEAVQNARVVANAEEYYRRLYLGGTSTWNLRDTHMADTLDALAQHLDRGGHTSKIVIWAHNSHVGDSDASSHRERQDEITLGHLVRERHPGDVVLVGFSTHHGTVTAASDWDRPAERKRVRPALPGSYEELFHKTSVPQFLLMLNELGDAAGMLNVQRIQRAIGVIYRPQTERGSHYFHVSLPEQLDAIIHIDETRAVEPLERTAPWEAGEAPETFPTGL
jgi:erythromycin esterase-like protein